MKIPLSGTLKLLCYSEFLKHPIFGSISWEMGKIDGILPYWIFIVMWYRTESLRVK